jgi:hypothetical protein
VLKAGNSTRRLAIVLLAVFLPVSASIGFESLDDGTVWKIWNSYYDYYFNASSGIQFTNHYQQYWTHNVFCAGWKSSGENESIFQDDFESWSTTEDCSFGSGWDSCYPGSGTLRGNDGGLAYDGTSLQITDSGGDNVLMKCGDLTAYDMAWVSFWGLRQGLDPGEYCAMDVRPFGGNWTTVFNSSNGTDEVYHHIVLDVTPYISNDTCVLIHSNASDLNEGCGIDDFNMSGRLEDWKYDCNDALPFTWSHDTDNATYVNITGYRDRTVGNKEVRLGVRYHLEKDDINLTVAPFVENLDSENITSDLGFSWYVNDIQIGGHEENDTIQVNGSTYWLNDTLDASFTELADAHYVMEDAWTHQWLRLDWNGDLNYTLILKSKPAQNNTPVRLDIVAEGPLEPGQRKATKLYWIDAANLWCGSGSSGTCPTSGSPCSGLVCSYTTCDCVADTSQTLDDNVTYYFRSLTVNSGVTLTIDYYPNGATSYGSPGGDGLGIAGGDGGGGMGGNYAGGGIGGIGTGGDYSGGGGKDSSAGSGNGGDGGGKITFNALDFIDVQGDIDASAEDAANGACKPTCGAGGGGGGAGNIHLVARNVSVSGYLWAMGGRGGNGGTDSFPNGNGGSGGGGGFVRIAAENLEYSGAVTLMGGLAGGGGFIGSAGDDGFWDYLLVRQTNPSNGSSVPAGDVDFRFNATSRLESTVSCVITLDGSVIYSNSSVYSGVITEHTESVSAGTKYWNVTCNMTANGTAVPTVSVTKLLDVQGGADSTPPTYSLNSTNSTAAGQWVEHRLHWYDAGGLSGYVFSFDNGTGSFLNDSWTPFSGAEWSNVTKYTNDTDGCTIGWCVYANDSLGNWNSTSCGSPFNYQAALGVYISISLSPSLQAGVTFGGLGPGTPNATSATCAGAACNVTVSQDTTVNVDIVTRVDSHLTRWGGSETVDEHWWNASNISQPSSPATLLKTSYDYANKIATNITKGTDMVFASWVSVPSGQPAGLYNNTIYFCATETGTSNC